LYDAEGRRLAKYSGGTISASYLLDLGGNQITELNNSGAWVHSNVFAGGRLLGTYEGTAGPHPNTWHFHLTDWLGTNRMQTTAAGNNEEVCYSYPFGDGLLCTGTADATEHHFTSKERDTESGLDYFFARYYTSDLARFMSPDWAAKPTAVPYATFGEPQTLNLYAYVNNNPNTGIDLGGHDGNNMASIEGLLDGGGASEVDPWNPSGNMASAGGNSGTTTSSSNPSGATTDSGKPSSGAPAPSNPSPRDPVAKQAPAATTASTNKNVCSEDDKQIVRDAAVKALSQLNPGQNETTNIMPLNGNFAKVADPAAVSTKGWQKEPSVHGTGLESPTIPGQSTFVVKMYNDPKLGHTIAVVYPSGSLQHLLGVIPFEAGVDVNAGNARAYMGCR
jgi:RHS repeat-associated protein